MFFFNKRQNSNPLQATVRDKPLRSLVKSITWRILGTLDTIGLSYIVTGRFSVALSIGSFEVITKMILYFLHERLWAIIHWGRMMVFLRRNKRQTVRFVQRLLFSL
jgi:uncharacterized membrane protein